MSAEPTGTIKLFRKLDQIFLLTGSEADARPVKLVWARPVSGQGQEVSLLDDKKKEVLMLLNLDALEPASRKIAEDELGCRYLMPRITRVLRTHAHVGTRYWQVETDHGPRYFVIRNPNRDVVWVTNDRVVLRDPLGNRFEIASLNALDTASRAEVDKVI
jgi:hypothetical protein